MNLFEFAKIIFQITGKKGKMPVLNRCGLCKGQMSSEAKQCPHCGQPQGEEKKEEEKVEKPPLKNNWDKLDIIVKCFGSLVIPGVLAYIGFQANSIIQQRNSAQETVKLAVTVLQSDKSEKTPELRKWALGVIENTTKDAQQTLPKKAVEELKINDLPVAPIPKNIKIQIVGVRFSPEEFRSYVNTLKFSAWKPEFVVLHHTASPRLAQRPNGFSTQHITNLALYYDSLNRKAGPHLLIDRGGIWVFSPLTEPGINSPSWNNRSFGVEMLGDYSIEDFDPQVRDNAVQAIAILDKAIGAKAESLHMHSEDPRSGTDCPGKNVDKKDMINRVRAAMK